ncbi:uncharacterized protein L969DRAFT_87780 [Mixia osmundae IAM 14324]|uniref:PLD phosphodiesterase domain-containing protein n=1 Tax=Mixia osmundae (strain CBS 9802 / IAM 14324 / JCM 22182 / KY 12970) TaxID=764103 RepID=G7E4B3_MIXOS|nr:uncharacterized protein L969DRAFT_87780 [Mixia osmundae IAM 14324]KEI39770.1 hypothetical protein L969DRAFT_87780 [Mixia osmundae IAM 14324]GAA97673.1 hypothetical protein E5Q_04351 [Mixia osmundae IAM 14324]
MPPRGRPKKPRITPADAENARQARLAEYQGILAQSGQPEPSMPGQFPDDGQTSMSADSSDEAYFARLYAGSIYHAPTFKYDLGKSRHIAARPVPQHVPDKAERIQAYLAQLHASRMEAAPPTKIRRIDSGPAVPSDFPRARPKPAAGLSSHPQQTAHETSEPKRVSESLAGADYNVRLEHLRQQAKASVRPIPSVEPVESAPFPASTSHGGAVQPTHETARAREQARLQRAQARAQALGLVEPAIATANIPSASTSTNVAHRHLENAFHPSLGIYFRKSAVRPTFNAFHRTTEDALSLQDIIGPKDRIEKLVMSSYATDLDWLVAHVLPPELGKQVLLALPGPADAPITSFVPNHPHIKLHCPPVCRTSGAMHIKLILVVYDDFCRVAIPTANLVPYDWQQIENAVWIQDFPRQGSLAKPTRFAQTLHTTLRLLCIEEDSRNAVLPLDVDFSAGISARMILSTPGSSSSEPNGHKLLGQALQDLHLLPARDQDVRLECQGSSIGALNDEWLLEFYSSICGRPVRTMFPKVQTANFEPLRTLFRIVFPTLRNIENTHLGTAGGGTLFCNRSTWENRHFPKECMRQSTSKRAGVVMHTKMILAQFRMSRHAQSDRPPGWLYVGSHNFTAAAWGKSTASSFKVSNCELGIVMALSPGEFDKQADLLVTWKRPLRPYGGDDVPWFQHEHR